MMTALMMKRQKVIFSKVHGKKQKQRGLVFLYRETGPKCQKWENPLEFVKLFITLKIAEFLSRETNWYVHQHLQKNPQLKEKSRVCQWKDIYSIKMKSWLLAFSLLQGLHQRPDNKSYFSRRSTGNSQLDI